MGAGRFDTEQRLAFGEVATLYHAARPSYLPESIDAIMDAGPLADGDHVVEVGAGTGKLTALLAARGLRVTAVEPSAEMAAVAARTCADLAGVQIVGGDFEHFVPDRPAAAVISAQAWHWVDPEMRYRQAHRALRDRGLLASIWTFPDWDRCGLRDALRDAYASAGPSLTPDFPMHPASAPERLAGDWETETVAGGLFSAPEVRVHRWAQDYDGAAYARLLATHQDHILMDAAGRDRLLGAVAAVVDGAGGLSLPLNTSVCLARRA